MDNGIEGSVELDGVTSLELALDRATEQYMATQHERRGRRRPPTRASTTTAMVVDGQQQAMLARLSWRGIEVTEEFQEYAARVARGEQLAPYRGQVLARHCPEFPWGAPRNEDTSTEPLPRFRSRVPRMAAWIFGSSALVMAALGIGSGTASSADDLDTFVPPTTTALALRPDPDTGARRTEPETRIATAIESALELTTPALPPASSRSGASPRPLGVGQLPRATVSGLGAAIVPATTALAARATTATASAASTATSPTATPSTATALRATNYSVTASTAMASTAALPGRTSATPSGSITSASAPSAYATSNGVIPPGPSGPSALFAESPPF